MPRLNMPFPEDLAGKAKSGRKTLLSLRRRYGRNGDTFEVDGLQFTINNAGRIKHVTVEHVATYLYRWEGYDTPQEFLDDIAERYPDIAFDERLYLHWFTITPPPSPHRPAPRPAPAPAPYPPTRPFALIDVVKTTTGRYSRKRSNGPTRKQQKPDGRRKIAGSQECPCGGCMHCQPQ